MRFKELRDADGMVLAQGLHPAIAVVAANSAARALATSAVPSDGSTKILSARDVDRHLRRAAAIAVEQHSASVDQKRARLADAEQSLKAATEAVLNAADVAAIAVEDLARFDALATRLACAEEAYEAAVQADAEAARSLAAALSELERVLGERHRASSSPDGSPTAGESGGIPGATVDQATDRQATLADAEDEKYAAVQQAERISESARAATRDALATRRSAHEALRSGMEVMSFGAPDWAPGLPLPGLLNNYRERLADAVPTTQAAESEAWESERSARSHLEQERLDLDALIAAGPPSLEPKDTIGSWVTNEYLAKDGAVCADDAFKSFDPETVAALLVVLAGHGGQVVYLTDNPEVLGWAIGLPHDIGAATTIASSPARTPVLVSE